MFSKQRLLSFFEVFLKVLPYSSILSVAKKAKSLFACLFRRPSFKIVCCCSVLALLSIYTIIILWQSYSEDIRFKDTIFQSYSNELFYHKTILLCIVLLMWALIVIRELLGRYQSRIVSLLEVEQVKDKDVLDKVRCISNKANISAPDVYWTDKLCVTSLSVGSVRSNNILIINSIIPNLLNSDEFDCIIAHQICRTKFRDSVLNTILFFTFYFVFNIIWMLFLNPINMVREFLYDINSSYKGHERCLYIFILFSGAFLAGGLMALMIGIPLRIIYYTQVLRADMWVTNITGNPSILKAAISKITKYAQMNEYCKDEPAMLFDLIPNLEWIQQKKWQFLYPSYNYRMNTLTSLCQMVTTTDANKNVENRFYVTRKTDKVKYLYRLRSVFVLIFIASTIGLVTSDIFKAMCLYSKGKCALYSQQWTQADRIFTEMIQYDKNSERYKTIGDIYFKNGEYRLAYKYYKINKPSEYEYIITAFLSGDIENACYNSQFALLRNENRGMTVGDFGYSNQEKSALMYIIGRQYQQRYDFPSALICYNKSLDLLGKCKLKDEIEQRLHQIKSESEEADNQYNLAWDVLKLNKIENAYAMFEKAYLCSADSTRKFRARIGMGTCKRFIGEYNAAKDIFLEVLPKTNQSNDCEILLTPIYYSIARGYWEEGDCKKSIEYARKAYELFPNNCMIRNQLAWYLITSQNKLLRSPYEAFRIASETVNMDHDHSPHYIDTLAACYASICDFGNAVVYSKQALALAQSNNIDVDKYEKTLHLYQNKQVPWESINSPVEYAQEQWLLILQKYQPDIKDIKIYAPDKWMLVNQQAYIAETSIDPSIKIDAYHNAMRLLSEGIDELLKPSFVRFDTGLLDSEVYVCIDAECDKFAYCGKSTEIIKLFPFKTYILEIRCPKKIWYRKSIRVDRPGCDLGTHIIQLKDRPVGGDISAITWEVINERIVKNIYSNGDITFTDTNENKMWVYDPTVFGRKNWADADIFCQSLVYGGYSDWNLPSVSDLNNMSSIRQALPVYNYKDSMDPSKIDRYWTTDCFHFDYMYSVYAGLNNQHWYNKDNLFGVFPMRLINTNAQIN